MKRTKIAQKENKEKNYYEINRSLKNKISSKCRVLLRGGNYSVAQQLTSRRSLLWCRVTKLLLGPPTDLVRFSLWAIRSQSKEARVLTEAKPQTQRLYIPIYSRVSRVNDKSRQELHDRSDPFSFPLFSSLALPKNVGFLRGFGGKEIEKPYVSGRINKARVRFEKENRSIRHGNRKDRQ